MKTKKRNYIFLAVLMMGIATMMTGCAKEDIASNDNGGGTNPTDMNVDELNVRVIADIPTAVMSSFDENSMGAALVRRLSNTTTSLDGNTKMVLIKGEDIPNRPITEWFQAAKIYLKGGFIAVEKPRNAHMVQVMEELSTRFEQAAHEILTEDDGSGLVINYIPPKTPTSGNTINAHAAQFENRIANIKAKAATRSGAGEADAVAEMVIFSRKGYYHCAPFGKNVVTIGTNGNSGVSQTITQKHSRYTSGLLADGAAKWINTKSDEQTVTKSGTRADGGGAINEIMSASEEYHYQADLTSMTFDNPNEQSWIDFRVKPGAYTEIYRIWGVNNTETNRDYYFVEQNVTVGMCGKQDGDARFDRTKTLYNGPYKENEWIETRHKFYNEGVGGDLRQYDHFYGSWFDYGEYKLNISGNGNIMIQNALPETDNNTTSVSIAVGETHSETNTIGVTATIGFAGKGLTGSLGGSYSHGWTDGTSYTMTTTTNSKELKCVKNTSGTQVQWYYSCGTDMEAGDDDEHPLAPDALTNDVNIKNQVCWSVDDPKGAYTVNTYHVRTTGWLSNDDDDDKVKGTCRADNEEEQSFQFTMLVPNRAKQTWYMDVTFPEIDDPNYAGVKTQLTTALQTQFPDIYQTSMELADLTPESENTIKSIVDASRKMLENPNAMQTLKEYGKTYQLSEYTIKWYNTMVDGDNNPVHGSYTMPVHVKD
jgi:hypothetical protein